MQLPWILYSPTGNNGAKIHYECHPSRLSGLSPFEPPECGW